MDNDRAEGEDAVTQAARALAILAAIGGFKAELPEPLDAENIASIEDEIMLAAAHRFIDAEVMK